MQPLQADPKTKAAKRVCFFPTQEKLKNKKFPPLQKNKTSPPHSPRQTIILTGYDFTQTDTATGHGRRRASANNQEFMWSVRPSMNSRLDEPPLEWFWLWKLEAVLLGWSKKREGDFEQRSLKK